MEKVMIKVIEAVIYNRLTYKETMSTTIQLSGVLMHKYKTEIIDISNYDINKTVFDMDNEMYSNLLLKLYDVEWSIVSKPYKDGGNDADVENELYLLAANDY